MVLTYCAWHHDAFSLLQIARWAFALKNRKAFILSLGYRTFESGWFPGIQEHRTGTILCSPCLYHQPTVNVRKLMYDEESRQSLVSLCPEMQHEPRSQSKIFAICWLHTSQRKHTAAFTLPTWWLPYDDWKRNWLVTKLGRKQTSSVVY